MTKTNNIETYLKEVFSHPPKKTLAPVKIPTITRLPGACFDSCTQECVDEPFHANCPGYDSLK
jgi:hypothetical protein